MRSYWLAMLLAASMSSVALADGPQPGERARELTTAELDSVTAGNIKADVAGLALVEADGAIPELVAEVGDGAWRAPWEQEPPQILSIDGVAEVKTPKRGTDVSLLGGLVGVWLKP